MESLHITESKRELSTTQTRVSKLIGAIGFGSLTIGAASHAMTLTTVIAGKTAAVGAIKTATVMTSAGPVVLSVVKAGIFSKIVSFTFGVVLAGLAGYSLYCLAEACFDKWNHRDKKVISNAIKSL
tara:strand:+ start:63 stop:440 length:378 start_codon:yes stop_codon:yes gene_type:complete